MEVTNTSVQLYRLSSCAVCAVKGDEGEINESILRLFHCGGQ